MPLFISNSKRYLNPSQQLKIDAFDFIYPLMLSQVNMAETNESLGKDKKGTKNWDTANDLMYVNTYLEIIKNRIQADQSHGIYKHYQEYADIYALDCIIKTFECNNINIRPLYAIYGLTLDTFYTDGVGYMTVQPEVGETPFDIG